MARVTIKLEAKNIYSALQSFSGIDQQTILSALDGDESSAQSIADFRIQQETRASNAEAVFGNLREGMNSMEKVIGEEAKFITATGQSLQNMTNSWADIRLADKRLMHSLEETKIRSDNAMIEEDYSHKRRINLLGDQHKGNIEIIRLQEIQQRHAIKQGVTLERNKLSLRDKTRERLNGIHQLGSKALKQLGQGLNILF